jgi:hypothetical protein
VEGGREGREGREVGGKGREGKQHNAIINERETWSLSCTNDVRKEK